MASPEVLGVSGGASLGYAAVVFGLAAPGALALALGTMAGGALALAVLVADLLQVLGEVAEEVQDVEVPSGKERRRAAMRKGRKLVVVVVVVVVEHQGA